MGSQSWTRLSVWAHSAKGFEQGGNVARFQLLNAHWCCWMEEGLWDRVGKTEWGASGAATVLNEDVMTAGTGCWLGGEIQVVRLCIRSGNRDSIKVHFLLLLLFWFLSAWQGMWNLGSPTRDQTCIPCIGRRVFLSTDPSLPPTPTLPCLRGR